MHKRGLLLSLVGLLFAYAPAQAQDQKFFDGYCTTGAFRVCSSVRVFTETIGGVTVLTLKVWNLEEEDDPNHIWGEAHTFTAVGLYHSVDDDAWEAGVTNYEAEYLAADGSTQTLTNWELGSERINTLQGIHLELGTDTDKGHEEGIVGCTDPGPDNADHVSTCGSFADVPYVRFTFTLDRQIQLNPASLEFRTHSQQIGPNDEYSIKCDSGVPEGDEYACAVVPEPVTMVLLGSGLAAMGGTGVWRRRREDDLVIEDE